VEKKKSDRRLDLERVGRKEKGNGKKQRTNTDSFLSPTNKPERKKGKPKSDP
jgi:hypothetical protein